MSDFEVLKEMFTRVGVNIVDHQFSDYILIENKNRIIEFKFNENDVLMFISCWPPDRPSFSQRALTRS
jgi:hypothetical protein